MATSDPTASLEKESKLNIELSLLKLQPHHELFKTSSLFISNKQSGVMQGKQ
jgi:hypothetical protein